MTPPAAALAAALQKLLNQLEHYVGCPRYAAELPDATCKCKHFAAYALVAARLQAQAEITAFADAICRELASDTARSRWAENAFVLATQMRKRVVAP